MDKEELSQFIKLYFDKELNDKQLEVMAAVIDNPKPHIMDFRHRSKLKFNL